MMLNIFGNVGNDPATQPKPRNQFADDFVGRFRSGRKLNNQPVSLTEWRVTTGDPNLADTLRQHLGGEPAQKWETRGEDNLEVFTTTSSVGIVIEDEKALKQAFVFRNREGKVIRSSDGVVLDDGTPDPQAHQTLAERKQAARDGRGPKPEITLAFRLAVDPDLGLFRFVSSSWSLAQDIAYFALDDALANFGGPVLARLSLEPVSFVAKNGPRAGQTVSYMKPTIAILGAAPSTEA